MTAHSMRRLAPLTALVTSLLAPLAARAQGTSPADSLKITSPDQCLQATDDYIYGRFEELRRQGQTVEPEDLEPARREFLRHCTSPFSVAHADSTQLPIIVYAAAMAADTARADSAEARMMALATAPGMRARALFIMALSWNGSSRGDRYVAALDSLGNDAVQFQFSAHAQLMEHAREKDIDAEVMPHARAIMRLGRQVGADLPPQAQKIVVESYKDLAEVFGDYGQADSALALIDRAPKEVPFITDIAMQLADVRTRYALVGMPAPTLQDQLWINAAPGTKSIPFAGKVTVLQFTASWCPPCRKSYATMRDVDARYHGKPVQVLFETNLYGNFLGKEMPFAEEIAADSAWYVQKNAIRFPVAIYRTDAAYTDSTYKDANADRYGLTDIPEIVIIDRKGIVRRVFTGWDLGNPGRISEEVEKLLKS